MSNRLTSFIRRVFNGSDQSYRPISNASNGNLPGAFPNNEAEPIIPNSSRSQFNSESFHNAARNFQNWMNILLIKPLVFLLVISFRLLAKIFNVLYFKDNQSYISLEDSGQIPAHSNDPIDKVNRFIRDLEDNLTPQQLSTANSSSYLPPFYQGSYTQALYMATNRAKFLFIYLTNPHNESSSVIFKKVVTNPEFIDLFSKNKGLIIWGGDLTNSEAYQLANSLNVSKFPFLGLMCLTRSVTMSQQGPIKTSPKISLVSKIQGGFSEEVNENNLIQNKFQKKIQKYEEELSLMRNELRDKYMGQLLQKQQELNYENSLAADRAKKVEKKYEEVKKQYLKFKANYFRELQREQAGPSSSTNNSKIAIKMKSGSRVTFNFPAENKVDDIFLYVELYSGGYLEGDESPGITESQAEALFQHFEVKYKFNLVSPLPPRTSLNEFRNCKIREIDSIYPNGLLIVEDS